MALYAVKVTISKQEDGLYRAECPHLQGCFVDSASLERAVADIQDAIRVWLVSQEKMGWDMPVEVRPTWGLPIESTIPVELPRPIRSSRAVSGAWACALSGKESDTGDG